MTGIGQDPIDIDHKGWSGIVRIWTTDALRPVPTRFVVSEVKAQ